MKVKTKAGEVLKVGRNDPCPCKSGRKFKKCCLPKIEAEQQQRKVGLDNMTDKLKNEFRDELEEKEKTLAEKIDEETEKVGKDEMVRRDNFVMMRQLQVEEKVAATSNLANEASIETYTQLAEEVSKLPFSEAAVGVLAMLEKRVEQLIKVVEGGQFGRLNTLTLMAFEVAAKATDNKAAVKEPEPEPTLSNVATEEETKVEDPDKDGDSEADMDEFDKKTETESPELADD